MIAVQYPEPDFKLKKTGEGTYLFDKIRKIWVLLTEEEWVRQNFINYLVTTLKYPSSVIALEKEIKLFELKKRFDILIYSGIHPWMLVECKAPSIPLSSSTLEQVLRYNISVPVNYIVITNGASTMAWKKELTGIISLEELPDWPVTG